MTMLTIIILLPAVALTLLLLVGVVDAVNLRRYHPTAPLPMGGFVVGIVLSGLLYAVAFMVGGA